MTAPDRISRLSNRFLGREPENATERAAIELVAWMAETLSRGDKVDVDAMSRRIAEHYPELNAVQVALTVTTLMANLGDDWTPT